LIRRSSRARAWKTSGFKRIFCNYKFSIINSQLQRAPAKLLLFGEYTILSGSNALALPLFDFYGEWTTDVVPGVSAEKQQGRLRELAENLTIRALDYLDLDAMLTDLDTGYWIRSNIPSGYGLGSSGVVTALIYDKYSTKPAPDLPILRNRLAEIESFFHGASSGIDPLTSYVAKPLLINGSTKEIRLPEIASVLPFKIYLLDSNRKRNTAQLVQAFKTKTALHMEAQAGVELLTQLSELCLSGFLSAPGGSDFLEKMKLLSKAQLEFMRPDWIPSEIQTIWQAGLDTGAYQMKLCGAGGGGFFLVFSAYALESNLVGFSLTEVA
jgi:mevalonate kinase